MTKQKKKIYIHRVEWCPAEYYMTAKNNELLASFAEVRDFGSHPENLTHESIVENLKGVEGILLLNGAHAEDITLKAIEESGSTLKVITVGHWWPQCGDMAKAIEGSGVKIIDASDPCNQAVAEWALGSIINGLRKTDVYDHLLKTTKTWPGWRGMAGQLNGSTIGIVALGRVGRWLLRYLEPFDVKVLLYDPYLSDEEAKKLNVEKVELDRVMKESDAISLHAPVLPSTEGIIGKYELGLMKDGALLVNSARTWLLDNEAFYAEMKTGRIRAYLDVFDPEPLEENDILRILNNVVMTPHIAGATDLMFERCGTFAIQALKDNF